MAGKQGVNALKLEQSILGKSLEKKNLVREMEGKMEECVTARMRISLTIIRY